MRHVISFDCPELPSPIRTGLEICIPIFRYDPSALIRGLARQEIASETTLRIYDDGSGDPHLTAKIVEALRDFPGRTVLMTAAKNLGRAGARNALMTASRADWLLFLDGDMQINGDQFLVAYQEAAARQAGPCCIVGGFDVDLNRVTSATRLHALQSCKSECLSAEIRNSDPGRYVFTSNIFLHRQIFAEVPFDSRFQGWGWEDVEWGISIARRFPVIHIDNAAIHLGLDLDQALLKKYECSSPNFMLMLETHPETVKRMPVYRYALKLSRLPFLSALSWGCKQAVVSGRRVLPASLRLYALKLFRASIYAQALYDQQRRPLSTPVGSAEQA